MNTTGAAAAAILPWEPLPPRSTGSARERRQRRRSSQQQHHYHHDEQPKEECVKSLIKVNEDETITKGKEKTIGTPPIFVNQEEEKEEESRRKNATTKKNSCATFINEKKDLKEEQRSQQYIAKKYQGKDESESKENSSNIKNRIDANEKDSQGQHRQNNDDDNKGRSNKKEGIKTSSNTNKKQKQQKEETFKRRPNRPGYNSYLKVLLDGRTLDILYNLSAKIQEDNILHIQHQTTEQQTQDRRRQRKENVQDQLLSASASSSSISRNSNNNKTNKKEIRYKPRSRSSLHMTLFFGGETLCELPSEELTTWYDSIRNRLNRSGFRSITTTHNKATTVTTATITKSSNKNKKEFVEENIIDSNNKRDFYFGGKTAGCDLLVTTQEGGIKSQHSLYEQMEKKLEQSGFVLFTATSTDVSTLPSTSHATSNVKIDNKKEKGKEDKEESNRGKNVEGKMDCKNTNAAATIKEDENDDDYLFRIKGLRLFPPGRNNLIVAELEATNSWHVLHHDIRQIAKDSPCKDVSDLCYYGKDKWVAHVTIGNITNGRFNKLQQNLIDQKLRLLLLSPAGDNNEFCCRTSGISMGGPTPKQLKDLNWEFWYTATGTVDGSNSKS